MHAVPVPGIQMLIVVPVVLFGQNMFFNIPAVAGHAIAAIHHVGLGQGTGRHPDPRAGVFARCIRPGFFADHIMQYRAATPSRGGIVPFIRRTDA